MEKSKWIWMNGEFVQWEDAKVHFLCHSLHYSGSIYEGIRCYKTNKGPAIFRLEDHIQRFFDSAKIIDMNLTWPIKNMREVCIEIVRKNNLDECYIRPLAYYGYGEMGISTIGKIADVGIAVWKWGAYLGKGREEGVKVTTSTWRKAATDAMPLHAKVSGNYTPAICAKSEAVKRNYGEAIFLDPLGMVAEGPGENLFLVKKGILYTPSTVYALEGITRDTVITIAKELDIPCHVSQLTRDDCYTADEMFFTGTAAEITPIVAYDDRRIGTGNVGNMTKTIQHTYFQIVRGEKPSSWLTYV